MMVLFVGSSSSGVIYSNFNSDGMWKAQIQTYSDSDTVFLLFKSG